MMIEIEQTVITVLDEDLAHIAQEGTYSQSYADGTTAEPEGFAFSSLLVRSDGVWKARFSHISNPDPQ